MSASSVSLHVVVRFQRVWKEIYKREKLQASGAEGDWTTFPCEVDATGDWTERSTFSPGLGARWGAVWSKLPVSTQHKILWFVISRRSRACELGFTVTQVWMGCFQGSCHCLSLLRMFVKKGKHWTGQLETLVHGVGFSRLQQKPSVPVNSL